MQTRIINDTPELNDKIKLTTMTTNSTGGKCNEKFAKSKLSEIVTARCIGHSNPKQQKLHKKGLHTKG